MHARIEAGSMRPLPSVPVAARTVLETIAFWATPVMTVAHLVFAVGMTLYMLGAIRLEERDLVKYHGEAYEQYRRRTSMIIPWVAKK
jgi:protein-S-isoprenylcysteine O-methyltransferase Ste14